LSPVKITVSINAKKNKLAKEIPLVKAQNILNLEDQKIELLIERARRRL